MNDHDTETQPIATRDSLPWKRILAPVDLSERSRIAVDYARSLAERFGATVDLVYVVEPVSFMSGMEAVPLVKSNEDEAEAALAQLGAFARQHLPSDVPVTTTVRLGKAAEAINALAQERHSDLMVITSHGYSGVKHLLLGSTAEHVLRHAPCPVLVIRAPASSHSQENLNLNENPMKIKDIDTQQPEVIHPETDLREAAQKMKKLDVGSLPVCDGERLVGMITDRDITIRGTAEGRDPRQTKVREVMTPEVIYCFDDQDVQEAAELMQQRQIRRLPVLNRDKRLVGILSLGDVAVRTKDERCAGEILERVSEPNEMATHA